MMAADTNPNGRILWEGPSRLDGAPIVVIATGYGKGSRNSKTGAMVQTWIMRTDVAPHEATKDSRDASVCGDCPLRPLHAKETGGPRCYVKTFHGPLSVWKAYKRGRYAHAERYQTRNLSAGRVVRLGSYGDPAAAPLSLWQDFTALASGWTGYTHQWRVLSPVPRTGRQWAALLMASADTIGDTIEAQRRGWRAFRVRPGLSAPVTKGEIACPASIEAGQRTTCAACKLCMGATSRSRVSIVIADHGPGSEAQTLARTIAKQKKEPA